MDIQGEINKFFKDNGANVSVVNRHLLLFNLFTHLKKQGFERGDLDSNCGELLLKLLTPESLVDLAKIHFATFLITDMARYMKLVFDSKEVKNKKREIPQRSPIKKEKDKDVILMPESESLVMDKSEFKPKEIDMELLKSIGINGEDLTK